MPAPKGNQYAKGNKGGNPGFGRMAFIKDKMAKYSPLWWKEWEGMMNGELFKKDLEKFKNGEVKQSFEEFQKILSNATDLKKFAMSEFNKLQAKMIPTQIAGDDDGGPLKMTITWENKKSSSPIRRVAGPKNSTKAKNGGRS